METFRTQLNSSVLQSATDAETFEYVHSCNFRAQLFFRIWVEVILESSLSLLWEEDIKNKQVQYYCSWTHCSKSSFFVQKFNFDFPRKLWIFLRVKNSWKCCGFGLFSCWQLWFHEKNCQKTFGWKTRENVGVLSKLNFWTKIWLFE